MMPSRHRLCSWLYKNKRLNPFLRHAMATPFNRTYSEFFASGLRAISGPSHSNSSSGYSSPALQSSGRYNILRGLSRRSRASSSPPNDDCASSDAIVTTTSRRRQTHSRRSSIVELPSRLFGRMMSPDTPDKAQRSEDALSDSYPIPPSSHEKIRPDIIDPFGASPSSKSFFLDHDVETTKAIINPISRLTPLRPKSQRPHSFLHLGESPTKTKPRPTYLSFALRRPRPISVQSMPLPSQSRRSSFQFRAPSRDQYDDSSWALDEEELEAEWSTGAENPHDPAASIDWRQFHNDLLHDD
ncbi:hypothetical protein R3P38DRAFT_3399618 [Favolaschia claudopus]|uniref:Uncharacterized protein n=1 Tax=Favolaschia claudopus TaxID=2862362 RepID=A0AAW0AVX8_9AGAR